MTLVGSAFAAGEYSIITIPAATITDDAGNTHSHTYKAIQIFAGTQEIDANDNNKLGDIEWATDVTGKTDDIIDAVLAVKSDAGLVKSTGATPSTATDVANVIKNFSVAQAEQLAK